MRAGARAVLGEGGRSVRVLDAAGALVDARYFHSSETARAWAARWWPDARVEIAE